jgi:hypothetical protein
MREQNFVPVGMQSEWHHSFLNIRTLSSVRTLIQYVQIFRLVVLIIAKISCMFCVLDFI